MEALGGTAAVADLQDLASGKISGHVLMNSTSVGMQPDVDVTPVPKSSLSAYRLVFDAVYTPVETRLLKASASAAFCQGYRVLSSLRALSYSQCLASFDDDDDDDKKLTTCHATISR